MFQISSSRVILTLLAVVLLPSTLLSQSSYSRARVWASETEMQLLQQAGVAVDHGHGKTGYFFESDFSDQELQIIRDHGLTVDVLIDDVQRFYRERKFQAEERSGGRDDCFTTSNDTSSIAVPSGFSLGSMGGFFTYQEFLNHLDTLAALYPNLITARQPIDTFLSHEGRPIYWVKVSDNPTVDENEPELLYTSIHHAREPASLSQTIFYLYYLCENYGTNAKVTAAVDNNEMFFIPMINPDGYVLNQTTDPNGGGMWRKNRRANGGGSFGVDLNRNYGYNWGLDNTGSSANPTSDTYRGPSAFSEPETQAVKWFCEQHSFVTSLNYHSFGNLLIYPWGYAPSIFTPDSAQFVEFAKVLTAQNNYLYGTGDQTVGYVTNGDSDDWMYGEQTTKNKIFSMTPEVGGSGDGFWPAQNRIIPLCQENVAQNLNTALLTGNYGRVEDATPAVLSQQSGHLHFEVTRIGLTQGTLTVSLTPNGTGFQSIGGPMTFNSLTALQAWADSVPYTLDPAVQPGQDVSYDLSIDNGLSTQTQTLTKTYGQTTVVLVDEGNNLTNWTPGGWGLSSTVYYSPTSSIHDSPSGDYPNNQTNHLVLANPIDLTSAITARVRFWTRWEIEAGWDYAQLSASSDGGQSWTPLCGQYTVEGNDNQDEGQPLWDGVQTQWVQEDMDLGDFAGSTVLLRFTLESDNFVNGDGFYIDDLSVDVIAEEDTNTAVNELTDQNVRISNFPNPANGFSYFAYETEKEGVLRVFDSFGQLVKTEILPAGNRTMRLETSNLAVGTYLYRLETEEGISTTGRMVIIR